MNLSPLLRATALRFAAAQAQVQAEVKRPLPLDVLKNLIRLKLAALSQSREQA